MFFWVGLAEVADGASGFPGGSEAGPGLGGAEAEDEPVHFPQQRGDFPEGGAEGEHGKVHVLAVGKFVFYGMLFLFFSLMCLRESGL